MVISKVDRQIIGSIAEMDGITCGLSGIVDKIGMDYKHAHKRLRRLCSMGLVTVDSRGKGCRLIIRLEAAALLLTLYSGSARGRVPVFVSPGLRFTDYKRVSDEQ